MIRAIPFYGFGTFYGTEKLSGARSSSIKGAGKWSKALQEIAKTHHCGHQVWVRVPDTGWKKEFADLLEEWVEEGLTDNADGYENGRNQAAKNATFFGLHNFAETVGLWLEHADEAAAALLSPFISTEGFVFTPAEFVELRERLQVAIRRYERLPEVSRGLEDLNTGFFRHRSLEESREFIAGHLATYLKRGDALHRDFLLAINRHARAGIFSARTEQQKQLEELAALKAALRAAGASSSKAAKKALPEIQQRWEVYRKKYAATTTAEVTLAEQINAEDNGLRQNQRNLFRELQSAGLSLNALTVNPQHGEATLLAELERRLNDLIREVDEAGLYQLPLRGTDAATTPRQLLQLEGLLEKLRNTRHHLTELPDFYNRRYFWYAQPAHLRRLLAPLLNLPTADWESAFTAWYFERCLEQGVNSPTYVSEPIFAKSAVALTKGKLHLLGPEQPWPEQPGSDDLLVSLTGSDDLPPQPPCRTLRLAPLHEENAVHFALSGHRNPVLLFTQSFLPLNPPAWRAVPAAAAPAGQQNSTVLLQSSGEKTWTELASWPARPAGSLNIFFPVDPTPQDEHHFLNQWEYLLATAEEIVFLYNWTPNDITQALLSDGFSAKFLMAALLRAAEAAEAVPFDREALVAIGQEIRFRCGLKLPGPHPLAANFGAKLQPLLPGCFFEIHQPWRDTFLPLVVLSPAGRKTVLLPEGKLPGLASPAAEASRQRELVTAGFELLPLDAAAIWENPGRELERVAELISQ